MSKQFMVAFLIGEEGPLTGLVIRFEQGTEWVLGRDPNMASQVLEDPMVSRRHVLCQLTPEGYVLQNLSVVNPAMRNGKPLEDTVLLQEGDVVQIGNTVFRFTSVLPADAGFDAALNIEDPSYFDAHVSDGRWLLKVVSGPNTGAEFAIDRHAVYVLGKDPTVCDVVFQDLSVSRQHARITCNQEGQVFIEDLGSRNGVMVNGEMITDKRILVSQDLIALGTTSFLVIDRHETYDTIFAPAALPVAMPPTTPQGTAPPLPPPPSPPKDWKEMAIPRRHIVIGMAFVTTVLIIAISLLSLFSSKPIEVDEKHPTTILAEVLKPYPAVQHSLNMASGKLFLVGHVLSMVERQELTYSLTLLPFIQSVEDNVVVDEFVWQNMNALLSANPDWKGVSVHSPVPGRFVVRGYVQTLDQMQTLVDYVNREFPYLDLLDNQVVVENILQTQVTGMLQEKGFAGLSVQLSNGELVLSGQIAEKDSAHFAQLVNALKAVRGIRAVKNFVVTSGEISSRIDLSTKYQVTGNSKKDGAEFSIVINGRILTKGDFFDGMFISAIDANVIFLEKDGTKFKINYNLQ